MDKPNIYHIMIPSFRFYRFFIEYVIHYEFLSISHKWGLVIIKLSAKTGYEFSNAMIEYQFGNTIEQEPA